ncbi:hypothetical protein [Roseomonas acroporae]|uniref:hypothetical protein n=1 Tax=Roseomonas acroporae TaxID=2937791 RepID=UPI00200AF7CB|nr:hypothetical protein [Roseomonas acroporae]
MSIDQTQLQSLVESALLQQVLTTPDPASLLRRGHAELLDVLIQAPCWIAAPVDDMQLRAMLAAAVDATVPRLLRKLDGGA